MRAFSSGLEYLKMGEDELYFETIDNTIVAAIVTSGDGKVQPFSIHVMLQFIGTKFVDMYYKEIEDMFFEWADIKQDLKSLQEVVIDDNGKSLSVRTECMGTCGKVFQAVGVAIPPTIREI